MMTRQQSGRWSRRNRLLGKHVGQKRVGKSSFFTLKLFRKVSTMSSECGVDEWQSSLKEVAIGFEESCESRSELKGAVETKYAC